LRIHDVIAHARWLRPYLGRALTALTPVERVGIGGMTVDKYWRLYYDPALLEEWEWGMERSSGAVIRCAMHLLRRHSKRCEKALANPDLYAIAATMEVTDDLISEKLCVPEENPLMGSSLGFPNDETAEDYYLKLLDDVDAENVFYGSGVAGEKKPFEEGKDSAPGVSEETAYAMASMTAQSIRDHESKHPGRVPAHWREWADKQLAPPVVPWQTVLGMTIRRAIAYARGRQDFSYAMTNRRQANRVDVKLPACVKPIIEVGVVLDTSGSMGEELLRDALKEVVGISKAVGASVVVAACDADVHSIVKMRHKGDATKFTGGGGGTDLRVGMALMEKHGPPIVVVLTDGETPWPSEEPPYKTIIGLVGGNTGKECPSWAKIVVVDKGGVHGQEA